MRPFFCDQDGVLVNQTSRLRFDLMGWHPEGRELWAFIAPLKPTILTQLMDDIYDVSAPEKRIWVARELGPDVPIIVCRDRQKYPHATPGAVLIDDSPKHHREAWERAGGVFIHHRTAAQSIAALKALPAWESATK